ncbi:MAG: class SAM-dependent methyltransferase [Bacteroidetes bacterium]|nr:class SAM-dependent methyltransferase [Bacteroidota bacterium]
MKVRTPYDRHNLKIKKSDRVLEVGSGHNPSFRSNVIVEKYIDNNYHRCGDVKIYPHQEFVNANGEDLPFKDKEFDYVICNQVLEHVDNPEKFINELTRVAKRGYIETPSLIGEFLFPKESHRWVILEIDNKLVFFEKERMPGNYKNNYGELFLNYLPYKSLAYKLLSYSEGSLMINRYDWSDSVEFIINPQDDFYLSFFEKKWNREMVEKLFQNESKYKELRKTLNAFLYMIKKDIYVRLFHKSPISIEEYMELKNK